MLKLNAIKHLVAVFIVAMSGLCSIPILTRNLSPSEFGHLSLLLMIFNFTSVFDGFRPVIIFTYHRYPKDILGFICTVKIILWAVGGIACVVVYLLLSLLYSDEINNYEIILLSFSAMLFFPMTGKWAILDAEQNSGTTSLLRAFVWMFVYLSFIIFSFNNISLTLYTFSFLCMNLVLLLLFTVLSTNKDKKKSPFNYTIAKEILNKSKHYLAFQVSAFAITSLDKIFLARMQSIDSLGYYTPQYELGTRSTIFLRIVYMLLFPRFSNHISNGNIELVREQWLHVTKLLLVVYCCWTWLIITFSYDIIRIYAGEDYVQYSFILRIIALGALLNFLGFMAPLLLNSFGDFKTQAQVYIFAAFTGIIIVGPLIYLFGIAGAAISYLIMRLADLFLFTYVWKKMFLGQQSALITPTVVLVSVFIIQLNGANTASAIILLSFFMFFLNIKDLQFIRKLSRLFFSSRKNKNPNTSSA